MRTAKVAVIVLRSTNCNSKHLFTIILFLFEIKFVSLYEYLWETLEWKIKLFNSQLFDQPTYVMYTV